MSSNRTPYKETLSVLTTTEEFDDAALAALIASAVLLGADVQAGLNTTDINPTKVLTVADMTEPTWATYARQNVVMGSPFRDPINGISSLGNTLLWQQTGTPTPVIIRGIFYTYGASDDLLGYEPINPPISLNDDLDAFASVLQYIQSNANAGFSTILR